MAKNAATHQGTCQCCGHYQKLPNGVLSLHGYTKEWGFFNGTCIGSGHKPFEQDISLIQGFIANAKANIVSLEAEKVELLNGATFAWMRVQTHTRQNGRMKSLTQWQKGIVEVKVVKVDETFSYNKFTWSNPAQPTKTDWNGREVPNTDNIESYSGNIKTVADATRQCNEGYIQEVIDVAIANYTRYIQWQESRIANWKPTELKPVATVEQSPKFLAEKELIAAGCTEKVRISGFSGRSTSDWYGPDGKWLASRAVKALEALKAK